MSTNAVQNDTGRPLSVEHVKTWAAIVASVAVTVGVLGGGIHWAVTSAVVPLVERLDRMDMRLGKMETTLEGLRGDVVAMGTRLTRVETLLDERLPATE